MNLLYFYLFLCQGNIRHILYASVKTGRLKLSKEEREQRCFTLAPPRTHLSFQCLLDSVVYDLRDVDIENDMTQTRTSICIHICGECRTPRTPFLWRESYAA